jgi:dCMP deaminase
MSVLGSVFPEMGAQLIRQRKWDIRYLRLAREVSTWSKDPSTQTGAVIVRSNGSVCSTGFNGFPQNMPDDPALYANREEKYSRVVHCEINAQIFSHDPDLLGYTLYTWPFASCDRCCVQMLQAGITRFVWPEPDAEKLARWAEAFIKTKKYITESGAIWTEIPMAEIDAKTNPNG